MKMSFLGHRTGKVKELICVKKKEKEKIEMCTNHFFWDLEVKTDLNICF